MFAMISVMARPEYRPNDLLGYTELSELTGHSHGYLRWLHWHGDMPAPDRYYGRSPVWSWRRIRSWVESRPRRR